MIERLVSAFRGGQPRLDVATWGPGRDEEDDDEEDADGAVDVADEVLFLDPDERILLLLSEHDGRLLQQDVVARTDYSSARISELLGEMEEEGRINRYWEEGNKVVTFPELEPR